MKGSLKQLKDLLEEYCFYKAESEKEQLNLKERLKREPKYPLAAASQFFADFLGQKAEDTLKAAAELAEDNDLTSLISRAEHNFRLYDLINFKLKQRLKVREVYHNEFIENLLQELYTDYGYLDPINGGIEVAKATDIRKFGIDCKKFNCPSPESNFQGQLILEHL